jgi:hypothetical protein
MHPKCPHCKDWVDLSAPHAVWNGKVYHCACVMEVIAAASRKVDVITSTSSSRALRGVD